MSAVLWSLVGEHLHSPKDLDIVIQLIIYYAINVKYIWGTNIVIKQMGRNLSDQIFIGVFYTAETSTIIILLSLFRKLFLLEWCEWWSDDIVLQFLAYYNSILITDPQSIFMDITKDL